MNIVIVGGGTAGWISAYFICKDHPGQHNITVIESSKIGIIGAGEGSTGTMLELINGTLVPYSVDINEFLKETDGTLKFGIYHQNWNGDNNGYFAPIDSTPTWASFDDYIFKHALASYGKNQMHLASALGIDFEAKNWSNPSAFHFDGHKVGKFFRRICEADGVTVIDAVVDKVIVNNNNEVEQLVLDNNQTLDGDFFIDCTGFARALIKEVGVDWISYKEQLPVDTAMPFIVNYEEGEEVKPMTTATALNAGWMWNIPLATRKGCGYVFDSNYISKEEAQAEVEEYLGKKITPIKFINLNSGKNSKFWASNVMSLGLASSFVEPLEATSIHSTIIQMLIFSKEYLYKDKDTTLNERNRNVYNEKVDILYQNIIDFISFHYQGGRKDTPFWKSIQEENKCTPRAKQYFEKCKNKIPGFIEIHAVIGAPAAGLWNWIAGGLGIITPEQALDELSQKGLVEQSKKEHDEMLAPYTKSETTTETKSYISYL